MSRYRLKLKNRVGATLAVVAVSLVAMLGVMALAIDLGMMFSARNEAQRVADSAALAGASAFLDFYPAITAVDSARGRAAQYITGNSVLGEWVDTAQTNIEIDVAARRVRVTVYKPQISTWFAKMFGIDSVGVSAFAAAEAVDAGAAKCVRPWAVQDLWHESNNVRPTETDKFDPASPENDYYVPVTEPGAGTATGYGNTSSDHGMSLVLKTQRPVTGNDTTALAQPGPGEFMIWEMPEDPTLESCSGGGGNTGSPSFIYRNSICGCNQNSIQLGVDYPIKTGNVVGPTDQGLDGLVEQDPDAYWNTSTNTLVSQYGMESPRVVKIALMAPLGPPPDGAQNWTHANLNTVQFTNFALMFVENHQVIGTGNDRQVEVRGRFLYYAEGEEGPVSGSLVKFLRLVE